MMLQSLDLQNNFSKVLIVSGVGLFCFGVTFAQSRAHLLDGVLFKEDKINRWTNYM